MSGMLFDEKKQFSLENWAHVLLGKWGKAEVLICKILYTFSLNFLFSQSTFLFYIICIIVYHTSENKCRKYVIKINTLFISEEKNWNKLFLEKGIFGFVKGHLCLTKGHLDNLEGQVEVEFG